MKTAKTESPFHLRNLVPLPYNRVSYQKITNNLNSADIQSYLRGKDCFRDTDYVILRNDSQYAISQVVKENSNALFESIIDVKIIALPDECHLVQDDHVDCGNPSALARKANELNIPSTHALIVEGAYGHVNFISNPSPYIIDVVDLVPPASRLYGLAQQALELADLPPILLEFHPLNLNDLAQAHPSAAHLFPCRASGLKGPGTTFYLDERPERANWLLIGCERSEQIHQHFYNQRPKRVETCPKQLCVASPTRTLIRCCLLEDEVEVHGLTAIIPWGANVNHAIEALSRLTAIS